ncbi:sugar ABC transporter ATP-binding protein [Nocardioides sp.]|uniref:sugar ABC transporter ATP-binding protein n=1 Tax=Nocardioides sp. TaxID=35761 RepID=UPI002604DFBA|nr:sugar ABC transporter ATP-binding protein [Nocardioides sp.]
MSKRYDQVQALSGVDVDLHAGRCHAFVGENGAGKSTLIKIVGGVVKPDSGTVAVDGSPVTLSGPDQALALGIAVVPQELIFVPNLSVAENISLGDFHSRMRFVDARHSEARARELLDRLGVHVDVREPLGRFSPAVQQLAMIARGLSRDARLLILDEPTASLSDREADHLFEVVDDLKASGIALAYVSHRMAELRRLSEDVTVLRDGERVASWTGEMPDDDVLVETMVGRSIQRFFTGDRHGSAHREERLRVDNLSRSGVLDDISFTVNAGEIVALTGLMGAGRTEVLRSLIGLDRPDTMDIHVDGKPVKISTPSQAKRAGLVLVPEERKTQGLVVGLTVSENISLPYLQRWSVASFIRAGQRRKAAAKVAREVGLRERTFDAVVRTLSGGNQQKVVLAKALLGDPSIILLDEPTRGIDVAVKHEIYTIIGALADAGCAVVIVSSDMLEVLGLADRIIVLAAGKITGSLSAAEATESAILRLAMPPAGDVQAPESAGAAFTSPTPSTVGDRSAAAFIQTQQGSN